MPKQTTRMLWDWECTEANHGLYSFQNHLGCILLLIKKERKNNLPTEITTWILLPWANDITDTNASTDVPIFQGTIENLYTFPLCLWSQQRDLCSHRVVIWPKKGACVWVTVLVTQNAKPSNSVQSRSIYLAQMQSFISLPSIHALWH